MVKPNIIIITAEHLRWDCLGWTGNPDVKTPNLDALSSHGVRFTNAIAPHSDSIITRASLLNGRYPWTCTGNTPLGDKAALPKVLKQRGYHTTLIGKLGLKADGQEHGFDQPLLAEQDKTLRETDGYHSWLKLQQKQDRIDRWRHVDDTDAPPQYRQSFGALTSNLPESHYSSTWIGNQAVRYLQQARAPFFLHISFIKPSQPYDPPQPWDALYDRATLQLPPGFTVPVTDQDVPAESPFDFKSMTEARFRRILAHYYAAISHMDQQVGRILATLTSRGITNNILCFCGINGDCMGHHGLVGPDAPIAYDPLIRIPLCIAGVAGQRRGAEDPALVELTDLMPTLLEAAGLSAPGYLSGKSLSPQLHDPGKPLRPVAHATTPDGARVARSATHKLLLHASTERCALFDLQHDPQEQKNLYNKKEVLNIQNALSQSWTA